MRISPISQRVAGHIRFVKHTSYAIMPEK
jgi:hypothetical protein